MAGLFDQQSWDGVTWADSVTGSPAAAAGIKIKAVTQQTGLINQASTVYTKKVMGNDR